MSFKQYLPAHVAAGLDETYKAEAPGVSGKAYYDQHVAIIEGHEMAARVFKEFLGRGGMRILESGCGTGRWMAYFERLGNHAVGVDDSWGPLRVARQHGRQMDLIRANALFTPLKPASFDAVYSSYVAEHFEDGPEQLFREIHRVLKPGGLFFVVVPFNNLFRRLVVNPVQQALCAYWRWRKRPLAFTEYRYTQQEMDGFLVRSGFRILRVEPDDFILPWTKGLFVDFCDVGIFFDYLPQHPYEFDQRGLRAVRLIRTLGLWRSCAGIFYVARAEK